MEVNGFRTIQRVLITAAAYHACPWAGMSYRFNHMSSILKPPSIQHHYPMVNNHKSNEIHKPLRWYLLSLILGSSDIHSLEVRASKPIIFSIYAIFPSFFITWIMLCVIIYLNISHHKSHKVHWIHSHCLYTTCTTAPFTPPEVESARLSLGQVHEKLMQFTLNQVKV